MTGAGDGAGWREPGRRFEQRALLLLTLLGLVPRILWAIHHGTAPAGGEVQNVAIALVSGRGFADPYFTGSGPTAHLLPAMPLLVGAVYALLGVRSVASETLLQLIALAEIFGGFLLLHRLFARLGVAMAARLAGYALLCLVPLFLGQESLDFRYWEGALGLLLAAAALNLLLTLERHAGPPRLGQEAGMAALAALALFVSPPLGLGVALAALLLLARRPRWPHRGRALALAAGALLLLFGPWTARNLAVFGRPIALRDNAPLELALANNPLTQTLPPGEAFRAQYALIHPLADRGGGARVRERGELGYMRDLDRRTKQWIAAHPGAFARLCLLHLREMLLPMAWQFRLGSGSVAGARAAAFGLVALLGLVGLGRGLLRGPPGWRYPAILVAVAVLAYLPFQPVPRYLYLIWGMLAFAAASLVGRLDAGAAQRG